VQLPRLANKAFLPEGCWHSSAINRW